ncbi:mu-type opioid receptor-like [Ruditapes philippinarum]|uniref:mu-type opioid receptor-like n=1 Tax=Ruditapes philippinarum TaxID=129788 RepID=UPI00295C2E55|nr:mu-type opioid receptor-like [Ruditapes philippinarum]
MNNSMIQNQEHYYAIQVWRYFPPIFLVVGTFGNCLTITVLTRRKNKISPTSVYLTSLAISDLIVLWAALLFQYLKQAYDFDMSSFSSVQCKLLLFFSYFSLQFSSFMIVFVTVERVICVLLPQKAKKICRTRSALAVSVASFLILFLVNAHWLFVIDVQTVEIHKLNVSIRKSECMPLTEADKLFIENVWPWIDLVIFYLIPSFVLIVGSLAIIIRLRVNKSKRQTQIAPLSNSQSATDKMSAQLTRMLLVLDIVFVVCTTPITVYLTIFTDELSASDDTRTYTTNELVWATVCMLMFFNNTINFVLYFLSGSKFRKEVKKLFCRDKAISTNLITGSNVESNNLTEKYKQTTVEMNTLQTKAGISSGQHPSTSNNH